MPRLTFLVWLVVMSLTVAGCASVGPRAVNIPTDLSELERWQARGRLGIASDAGGGSGSFVWQQRKDRAEVQIRGPVGIGSVRLEVEGEGAQPQVRLETGDGQVLESSAAWRELEARLGAPIPAGHLRYWMLGVPAPGEHRWLEQQPEGTAALEQHGWRIDYQSYSSTAGARVPVRIQASSGSARVRIVVDTWQLGGT